MCLRILILGQGILGEGILRSLRNNDRRRSLLPHLFQPNAASQGKFDSRTKLSRRRGFFVPGSSVNLLSMLTQFFRFSPQRGDRHRYFRLTRFQISDWPVAVSQDRFHNLKKYDPRVSFLWVILSDISSTPGQFSFSLFTPKQ